MMAQQHKEGLQGEPHPFPRKAEEEMLLSSTQHPMFLQDFAEGAADACGPGQTETPHVPNGRQVLAGPGPKGLIFKWLLRADVPMCIPSFPLLTHFLHKQQIALLLSF